MVVLGSAAGLIQEEEISLAFQLQFKVRDATSSTPFKGFKLVAPSLDFLSNRELAKTLTDSCRSPRGKDFVNRLAYHQITFDDYFIEPVMHDVMALIRRTAMTEGISDEVEKIIWSGMRGLSDDVRDDRFDRDCLLDILFTYGGAAGAWNKVHSALRADLVPTMAFVMGHRYLAIHSPARAKAFFETVRDTAPAGSPLVGLAKQSLEEIGKRENTKSAGRPKR
jgi:hypothetical protein